MLDAWVIEEIRKREEELRRREAERPRIELPIDLPQEPEQPEKKQEQRVLTFDL